MRRTTKKIMVCRPMTNDETTTTAFPFRFRASSFLRHSSFELRHPPSLVSRHHKHVLQMREVHGRRYSRLAVELTHPKTLHRPDKQPRWENATNAGRVHFCADRQV